MNTDQDDAAQLIFTVFEQRSELTLLHESGSTRGTFRSLEKITGGLLAVPDRTGVSNARLLQQGRIVEQFES